MIIIRAFMRQQAARVAHRGYQPWIRVRKPTIRRYSIPFSTGSCQRIVYANALPSSSKPSILRRTLGFIATTAIFTSAGFILTAAPAIKTANNMLHPPTDEATLSIYMPEDETSRKVEEYIQTHPVVSELRSNPEFIESRPHLKIPRSQRGHNLTGGTLIGPRKVVVPPLTFCEKDGKSLVSISYLGVDLCGHPGIIHGGLLATMLDEGMAKCCFAALPNKVGMTANLKIDYRAPASADLVVVLRAKTTKVEGRKAWVEGRIETLAVEGELPIILAEASALFIEPKQAATMARVYPVP